MLSHILAELEHNVKEELGILGYKTHIIKKINGKVCMLCQRCGNYMKKSYIDESKKHQYCYCFHDASKSLFIAESFTHSCDLVKENACFNGYSINCLGN
jgi:hypothetical protein